MQYIYLGLFQDILDFVLDHIFSPVFRWLSELLGNAIKVIFENVLGPLLKEVFVPLLQKVGEGIMTVMSLAYYRMLSYLMYLVDIMMDMFGVFIGLKDVTNTKTNETGSLLELLFRLPALKHAFIYLTGTALALLFLLTVYAVVKSVLDFDLEGKRPVSRVLSSFFKSAFNFLIIPIVIVAMLRMSTFLLRQVDSAISLSQNNAGVTMGTTIFVISSLDACKDEKYNVSYDGGDKISNIGSEDSMRSPFYHGKDHYYDITKVMEKFKISKMNYLLGFGLSVFILIVLLISFFVFVQRMFEVMLLYLAAPFFAASMVLDDGEKFQHWKSMLMAKVFGGFGIVIGMRLYMLLCPTIMSSEMKFGEGVSTEVAYLVKAVFLMGGAYAIIKSGSIITGLINDTAGYTEAQAAEGGLGAATAAVGTVASFGGTLVSGAIKSQLEKSKKSKDSSDKDKSKEDKGKDNKFSGGSGTDGSVPGLNSDHSSGKTGDISSKITEEKAGEDKKGTEKAVEVKSGAAGQDLGSQDKDSNTHFDGSSHGGDVSGDNSSLGITEGRETNSSGSAPDAKNTAVNQDTLSAGSGKSGKEKAGEKHATEKQGEVKNRSAGHGTRSENKGTDTQFQGSTRGSNAVSDSSHLGVSGGSGTNKSGPGANGENAAAKQDTLSAGSEKPDEGKSAAGKPGGVKSLSEGHGAGSEDKANTQFHGSLHGGNAVSDNSSMGVPGGSGTNSSGTGSNAENAAEKSGEGKPAAGKPGGVESVSAGHGTHSEDKADKTQFHGSPHGGNAVSDNSSMGVPGGSGTNSSGTGSNAENAAEKSGEGKPAAGKRGGVERVSAGHGTHSEDKADKTQFHGSPHGGNAVSDNSLMGVSGGSGTDQSGSRLNAENAAAKPDTLSAGSEKPNEGKPAIGKPGGSGTNSSGTGPNAENAAAKPGAERPGSKISDEKSGEVKRWSAGQSTNSEKRADNTQFHGSSSGGAVSDNSPLGFSDRSETNSSSQEVNDENTSAMSGTESLDSKRSEENHGVKKELSGSKPNINVKYSNPKFTNARKKGTGVETKPAITHDKSDVKY